MNEDYCLPWPMLEAVGDHFLQTVADNPGITAAQLSEKLGAPLESVQAACEYGLETDQLVSFEGPADTYYFLATNEGERVRRERIKSLWKEAAEIVKK